MSNQENVVELVKSYLSIEKEMKELSKKIAELRPLKLSYSEQISDYISNSGKDSITIGNKTIKLVKNKKKVFKRKNMEDSVKSRVKDHKIQEEIFKDALEEQEANSLKIL